jgi:murein DD-endopeptidase MepM/ murein hydrolase activator NlpD
MLSGHSSRAAFAPAVLAAAVLAAGAPAALAISHTPGGARAPSSPHAGGAEYGVTPRSGPPRPVVARLSVPRTTRAGRAPRVILRIEEENAGTVWVRVAINSLQTRRTAVVTALGWVPTGRNLTVRWPAHARLSAGVYHVSVTAHDRHGATLLRRAHSSGVKTLTVTAPAPPAAPPVAPAPAPAPPSVEAGVPTPAQTVAYGAVFPVAGAHNYGSPEGRFGAPRAGHIHQGQDVLAAEGTPVVAPLAGVISWTSFQAGGAGYYVVEHTGYGFDFMFAHCREGSITVAAGKSVAAGTQLCEVGQTGDAEGPHLHFEMWVGGWQASSGHPIDPLPYLQAWEGRH